MSGKCQETRPVETTLPLLNPAWLEPPSPLADRTPSRLAKLAGSHEASVLVVSGKASSTSRIDHRKTGKPRVKREAERLRDTKNEAVSGLHGLAIGRAYLGPGSATRPAHLAGGDGRVFPNDQGTPTSDGTGHAKPAFPVDLRRKLAETTADDLLRSSSAADLRPITSFDAFQSRAGDGLASCPIPPSKLWPAAKPKPKREFPSRSTNASWPRKATKNAEGTMSCCGDGGRPNRRGPASGREY